VEAELRIRRRREFGFDGREFLETLIDRYAAAGGDYREVVIEGAAHVPFITAPEQYDQAFHAFLQEHRP